MFSSNSSHDRNCRQPEARIGNVRRPGNSMDRNLITCYYAEKYCDKRFFYRVFMVWQFWSLIRAQKPCDPWSLSSEPWALASEPWSQSYFGLWALSPYTMLRPWYSVNMALGILQCEEEQRCSLQKSDKTIYYVACKTGVIGGALVGFAVGTRAEINSSFSLSSLFTCLALCACALRSLSKLQ